MTTLPPTTQLRLDELIRLIPPPDEAAAARARARQAQLTKPPGALGDLEELAVRLAAVLGTERPDPRGGMVIVSAADHGVAAEGVSAYPASVTPAMLANFTLDTPAGAGGAAVNAIARSAGASVTVLDVGVNTDEPFAPPVVNARVRRGTRNLRAQSAMTRDEALRAILAGADAAERAVGQGHDLIVPGELGIANTTAAAAVTARMLDLDPAEVTGRGTGVDDERLAHKVLVIRDALARNGSHRGDPLGVLADLGGLEIAAMVGVMLAAARHRRVVVLDGFVEGAAALIAVNLCEHLRGYLFPAGLCAERGHAAQLAFLGLRPLFSMGLRLGEGTGGVLALPLLRAAAAAQREMLTFAEAGVPTA